jgi:hypothetical protein
MRSVTRDRRIGSPGVDVMITIFCDF